MADDPLTRLYRRIAPAAEPAKRPGSAPGGHALDRREAYEAFDNKIRAMNCELRCWRTGLSYSVPYSHMSTIVFEFLSGEKLTFDAGGYGFTIVGENLRAVLMALNLHTCGFIQDFHSEHFIMPEPVDAKAPFIRHIDAVVLRPLPRRGTGEPG